MKKGLLVFISILVVCSALAKSKRIEGRLVIGRIDGGLFSCLFAVLNNLAWCEKNDAVPVIHWGEDSYYYVENGHNGSHKVWEYYFEPLSSDLYKEGEYIWRKYIPPGRSKKVRIPEPFSKDYRWVLKKYFRLERYNLIQKYIKIKPIIAEKIDSFYAKNMLGKKTIGIHLRGTDKNLEIESEATITTICNQANTLAQTMPGCQFLVATDEEALLQEAITLLNGPVVYYDSYRSLNGEPIHDSEHSYNMAKLGEEVLIEVSLLARCDAFIHTRSNVSTAVLLFNPELEHKVLY